MKKFLENFWYYHKWKLLVGIMILLAVINTVSAFVTTDKPDYTIGVVTAGEVPEELCQCLSEAFSGVLPDTNGDGTVQVTVNVYRYGTDLEILPGSMTEGDAVHLAANIQTGESCLFLTDEPEIFQEAGLTYGGSCVDVPVLEPFADKLENFVFYFPASADSAIAEALR